MSKVQILSNLTRVVSTISFAVIGDFVLLLEQLNNTDKQSKKTNLIPSLIRYLDNYFLYLSPDLFSSNTKKIKIFK